MKDALRSHRSPLLDCLRAVAIAMVVVYHVATVYKPETPDALALFLWRYGALGVDIFFPLSGYLICRFLLTHDGPAAIKVFFMRRFFRIVPLYVTAVTLFLAAMVVVGIDAHLIDRIWINYLFLTGWFMFADGHAAVPYSITWTLSVEEFAYVVFGLLALAGGRRRLPLFLLFCAVAPSLLRWWLISHEIRGMYYLPPARIDSIAIGGLVAWAMIQRPPLTVLAGLALTVAGLVLLSQVGPPLRTALLFLYIPLIVSMVIVAVESWTRVGYGNRLIDFCASVGFHSYFTYLIHYFNIYGLAMLFETAGVALPPFWIFVAMAFGLTHVMAVLSFRLFEGPLIRYGRSLERPRAAQVPAGSAR